MLRFFPGVYLSVFGHFLRHFYLWILGNILTSHRYGRASSIRAWLRVRKFISWRTAIVVIRLRRRIIRRLHVGHRLGILGSIVLMSANIPFFNGDNLMFWFLQHL